MDGAVAVQIDASLPAGRSLGLLPGRPSLLRVGLNGLGVLMESFVVAGLGAVIVQIGGAASDALPAPVLVAAGYVALLLLQGGAADRHGAKIGPAVRALASAFICLALAVRQNAMGG